MTRKTTEPTTAITFLSMSSDKQVPSNAQRKSVHYNPVTQKHAEVDKLLDSEAGTLGSQLGAPEPARPQAPANPVVDNAANHPMFTDPVNRFRVQRGRSWRID